MSNATICLCLCVFACTIHIWTLRHLLTHAQAYCYWLAMKVQAKAKDLPFNSSKAKQTSFWVQGVMEGSDASWQGVALSSCKMCCAGHSAECSLRSVCFSILPWLLLALREREKRISAFRRVSDSLTSGGKGHGHGNRVSISCAVAKAWRSFECPLTEKTHAPHAYPSLKRAHITSHMDHFCDSTRWTFFPYHSQHQKTSKAISRLWKTTHNFKRFNASVPLGMIWYLWRSEESRWDELADLDSKHTEALNSASGSSSVQALVVGECLMSCALTIVSSLR